MSELLDDIRFVQKLKQVVDTKEEEFVIIAFLHKVFLNEEYDRNEAFALVMKECRGHLNPKIVESSLGKFEAFLSHSKHGLFQC